MKIVLAVSGGVDSMAMMDFCAKKFAREDLVVAHFDHNVRENSREDLEFVRRIAGERDLEFVFEIAPGGICKSENAAREMRYEFLRRVAAERDAEIFVAHHLDDLVETVAINFVRGTGWRGLAGMDAKDVRRPFLECGILGLYEPMDKNAIFEYAAKRGLRFREDQTNFAEDFLRNRVRGRIENENFALEKKMEIYELWRKQKNLKREIDAAVREILAGDLTGNLAGANGKWSRKWFWDLEKMATKMAARMATNAEEDDAKNAGESWRKVAVEILRAGTLDAGVRATRPQLMDFYQAILDYAPGKKFNLPNDKLVKFSKDEFEI